MGTLYEEGVHPAPNTHYNNERTWLKVTAYMKRRGPQDEDTIKLLCGRHKPGTGDTPAMFFRYALRNGWLKEVSK